MTCYDGNNKHNTRAHHDDDNNDDNDNDDDDNDDDDDAYHMHRAFHAPRLFRRGGLGKQGHGVTWEIHHDILNKILNV